MKVEIIICTYNRVDKLRGAIQSILDAEIPENASVQLTVVDNNSIDNTESVTREFSENNSGMEIKYLFEKKQGKSHALNTALKHITGDLIAFSDDDQIVDAHYLKEMVNAVKKHPEYNCFGGKVLPLYPDNMPQWIDINGSMGFLKSVFGHKDEGNKEIEYGNGTISKTPGGGNMFFRREAVEKNGLFRTDLGPIGEELGFSEDTEYCQRLLEKDEKFMYIPSSIVYHSVYTKRLTKGYLLNWQYKCGRSEVRKTGGYKDTAKVFGVPMYLVRKFIQHVVGWGLSVQSKIRFYHKLRLYYTTGEIVEHFKIGFKKQ